MQGATSAHHGDGTREEHVLGVRSQAVSRAIMWTSVLSPQEVVWGLGDNQRGKLVVRSQDKIIGAFE